ncbi:MAG TPA: M3 family metallopeptidase [Marmoricola sp.]|nr:M3 family metallopeptidase [Marmoricola sp.]
MTLQPLALPEGDWAGWLGERGREQLRLAGDYVAALKAATPGDGVVLQLWNDANLALTNALSVATTLQAVHPDPAVVRLAEEIEADGRRFGNDLLLDEEVFGQLRSIRRDPLDDGAGRVLELALRDFRRAGVDRDQETRGRLHDLNERLTALDQAFSRNIRDGRRQTRVPASALEGMPEDFREAHPVDADGMVTISTEYPDTRPFLRSSSDAEARRQVAQTFFNLAWPDNDAVLRDLLATRHEKATLLGYDGWPDYDAEVKMIGSGKAIGEFIDEIAEKSGEKARAEVAVLLERAGEAGEETLDLANWSHWFETVKRERYGVDANEVRRYFDFPRVRQGLLEVTSRLFGVTYTPVRAASWHEEVASYDVALTDTGERIGRIHLDLHPREHKYNHAAQFDLVPGIRGRQLAEGVLVCNFPRGLMDHHEVVTLFHEFGHLLHHVLAGRHDWVRFSGVATEWDFVEAPSQMLEEWAWDADVLQTFATDADGTPIPTDLVQHMREADEYGLGLLTRTQMFYAAVSYRFHKERPEDLTARMWELYDEYSLVRPLQGTHFHTSFGHLGGYSSGYYTYMWSKVIAKDMFSAFDPDDLFAQEVARRYRDRVLVPGGSRDAAVLVADFLGRPYDAEAFTAWLTR